MSTKKSKVDKEDEFVYLMDDSNMATAQEYKKYVKEHPDFEKTVDEIVRNLD